jgi:HAD superfamily hydrolase (TIGR01509 family)
MIEWNQVRACIFDMDDLMVATADLWRTAEMRLFAHLGQPWDAEIALRYKGMNALDVAATIRAETRTAESVERCQAVMRDALIAEFAARPPAALPGAVEIVRRLSRRYPLAVASGSPRSVIESVVRRLEIQSCFSAIVSSEQVARGKPHPDVFLKAAEELNTSPSACVVFEDSLIGVRAARAAEMQVICIPSGNNADEIRAHAPALCQSFTELLPTLE